MSNLLVDDTSPKRRAGTVATKEQAFGTEAGINAEKPDKVMKNEEDTYETWQWVDEIEKEFIIIEK